jgi:hypothetical protein
MAEPTTKFAGLELRINNDTSVLRRRSSGGKL